MALHPWVHAWGMELEVKNKKTVKMDVLLCNLYEERYLTSYNLSSMTSDLWGKNLELATIFLAIYI